MNRIDVMLEPARVFLAQVADFLPRLGLALVVLIAGWLSSNGAASSFTEASPPARRARMARRVGSARAAKVTLSWSGCCLSIAPELYNHLELYQRDGCCQALAAILVGAA